MIKTSITRCSPTSQAVLVFENQEGRENISKVWTMLFGPVNAAMSVVLQLMRSGMRWVLCLGMLQKNYGESGHGQR